MENPLSKYDGDVYFYGGFISRDGYHQISDALEARIDKKEKCCLILITNGGDPNAGYRIARAFNHHYKTFEILIPDVCKSAGTLMCIGAKRLIFGDRGELGPLDIQLSKPDEMFDNMSGLAIIQALSVLETKIINSFHEYLVNIRSASGIRTKTAADLAIKLADSLVAPIASKIDPLTLGEHQRAMQIAIDYGMRLNDLAQSLLSTESLYKLVSGYPSHAFVIDRKEASTVFTNVNAPCEETNGLYVWIRKHLLGFNTNVPKVIDLTNIFDKPEEESANVPTDQPKPEATEHSEDIERPAKQPVRASARNKPNGK